jgi:pimeloyl-ACP methyl ester carboxylesterase
VLKAKYDPSAGVLPFPNNLFFKGTTDLTINLPVEDPNNLSDPKVALNALDGFSTTAPWSETFSKPVKPSTVVPGQSVRLFKVTLTGPGGAVVGVDEELTPGVHYVATPTGDGSTVAIVPLAPMEQIKSYMAVMTNDITDTDGNAATPDQTYFLAKRTAPLVDANGHSTDPLISDATAQALEPLRQLVNSQEAAAEAAGIPRDKIVVSWTATTQSITPVLSAVRSTVQPSQATLAPTGMTTAAVIPGSTGPADIYVGVIGLPYYLTPASGPHDPAPLQNPWKAIPGNYVPPFDQFGLDPTSTNLTYANPFPAMTTVLNVPVLMTVPNANSGLTKPAEGWPVVIFQHGITRNRLDMLAIADTMAGIGYAVIAMDTALHGVTDPTNPFYVENTPFGAIANERTFDLDLVDNTTGAPGPDGVTDSSGSHFINLSNLLVSRDNVRQTVADLFTLTATIPTIDIDGDSTPDLNGANLRYVGHSLGAIIGTDFLAMEPNVTTGTLNVPGGGIAKLLDASPTFGPRIRAGLAAAGLEAGTPEYESFMVVTQTVVDSADPINFGAFTAATNNVLLQDVLGDNVIPNSVPTAPLSGTEPLIRVMGLPPIAETTVNPAGIDGAVRFTEGDHGSILSPAASVGATVEMQTEMASMTASGGTLVQVANPSVIVTE